MKKEYQFKNNVCPICNKEIDSYFYTINKRGDKLHLDCAVEAVRREKSVRMVDC